MKISIYSIVKNGIYMDYHVKEMLKHHLPLADEIIINEGNSSDGTYEVISELDPKIKVFRSDWKLDKEDDIAKLKNDARKKCTGDWCILLDIDEFIPEWEFKEIKEFLKTTDKIIIPINYINFYGNYKVYNKNPKTSNWMTQKMQIHKNLKDIEVYGDGAHVRLKGSNNPSIFAKKAFSCHHFGTVRYPYAMRHRWRILGKMYGEKSKEFDDLDFGEKAKEYFKNNPYDWKDPQFIDDLEIYEGPYVKTVRENTKEFIRDDLYLYNYLKENSK